MTADPEPLRVPREPDVEDEVDLRRYVQAIAARWWLPLVGLLAGVAAAYALSIGEGDVWRGRAVVYLGQPLSPTGAQLQTLNTNPSAVNEVLRSGETLRRVARQAGVAEDDLEVTSQQVSGNITRQGQNPLVAVIVRGEARGKVAGAANLLAVEVVDRVAEYADEKIALLEEEVQEGEAELRRLNARVEQIEQTLPRLAPGERAAALSSLGFVEQRRGALREDVLLAKQNLALAEEVERPRVLERAVSRKVTAQSRRNTLIVGGFLGLLLGIAAALLWDPVARARQSA
jgi:uncharacterized protein involved in exopolysaccharide biosynthesis